MLRAMASPTEAPNAVVENAVLENAGLDALWVTRPQHVQLLSGFTSPEDGLVLLTREGATLYTDARYEVQAAQESRIAHFIGRPPRSSARREMLSHAGAQVRGKRVGVEAEHLTLAALDELQSAWQAELVATSKIIEQVRQVKTPAEIAWLREAARIADEAYGEVLPTIKAGRREIDVALDLELAMRRRGAGGIAFEIIVASGERGAMPHGRASEKVIEDGELVTVDMGALYRGYHGDMTRTVGVGEVREELRRLYRAVLEAEQACVSAVKPGARAADLDKLARDMLEKYDLAQYFAHSLGHGVGLAIHEGPSLSSVSEDVLANGMAITIEPGVYLPGVGGVRIEDLLLITEDGHEVLSRAPKQRL